MDADTDIVDNRPLTGGQTDRMFGGVGHFQIVKLTLHRCQRQERPSTKSVHSVWEVGVDMEPPG